MASPLVSIIIPNYNERELLFECLDSFKSCEYEPVEKIVVDNGSTDGSKRMVQDQFPTVRLLEADESEGIGHVNNVGIRAAQGDIICFNFNNDEVVESGWISELVSTLSSNDGVKIVGGLRVSYQDREVIDSAGATMDFIARANHLRAESRDIVKEDGLRFVDYVEVPFFTKDLLSEIGPLDERYHFYYEDVDFCLRAKQRGAQIAVNPNAISYHRRGGSTDRKSPLMNFYSLRNKIRLSIKLFSPGRAVASTIFWGVFFPIFATFYFGVYHSAERFAIRNFKKNEGVNGTKENFRYVLSCYQATWWNLKNIQETLRERSKVETK